MANKLNIVGLTGGIASGKSTVAQIFREAGIPVMDADQFGHMVLARNDGAAFRPVVEAFGEDILGEEGEIDRQKLGEKVFGDETQRKKLESITHPAIAELSRKGMQLIEQRGATIAVYEAALLVETGIHKGLSALVVVSCSVSTQLMRVMARDGHSREAAAARIASQYPLEEKLKVADYVIFNDGDLEDTQAATLDVIAKLKSRFDENP